MLPALVAQELEHIAEDQHRAHPEGPSAERIEGWLGALIPRAMFPGGWASGSRHVGGEPLWTGRRRPYDESTLRKVAKQLDEACCSDRVAQTLWDQVDRAVVAGGEPVIGNTDMTDQPLYTKKLAHAAPIGRLGNRILGATYFGLTTVAIPLGPTLFAHMSWHKPAAPLRDALEDLLGDPVRERWWARHVRLHIVDRGANGDPVVEWLWRMEVPYLTIGRKSADLWRFRVPTLCNDLGLPIVVRPDGRLDGTREDGPWEVIVPADPEDADEVRGLVFRAGVPLSVEDLRDLNTLYKSRWPSMENQIKALLSRGFGRNRTRVMVWTTSRGTDGKLDRLTEREDTLMHKLRDQTQQPASDGSFERLVATAQQILKVRAEKDRVVAEAPMKYARPEGGAERLSKWLHLLTHNALALALYTSADETVRTMEPTTLFDLLLGRPALSCIEATSLTMWVTPVTGAADRRLQAALVDTINKLHLRCRGLTVTLRIHEVPENMVS